MIEVTVFGEARPAGALAIGRAKDGRQFLRHRDGRDLGSWKRAIAKEVGQKGAPLLTGAVSVRAEFFIARPAGHYGTGRNEGQLRTSAPAYPVKRTGGDIDKLARACLDALTGIAFRDDSQVVTLTVTKRFADTGPVRLELRIRPEDELDVLFELQPREEVA